MPFKTGEIVTIYNQKFSGEPICEGRATIIKPSGVPDQYRVRFNDGMEHGTYLRFVYSGECQTDPEGYIAAAKLAWHEGQVEPLRA